MSEDEEIEEDILISRRRKPFWLGSSQVVTLPRKWLDFQKFRGQPLTEVTILGNEVIIMGRPKDEEIMKEALRFIEKRRKEKF